MWQSIPIGLGTLHFDLQSNSEYDLLFRYKFQKETFNHYLVIVKPYWWQTILFKVIAATISLSFITLMGFYFYRKRNEQQLLKQREETEKLILKLRAIHGQLNPHFIFNSLNSIQGLINTNNISKANEYLSEFSNLMRNTLIDSDKIYHSLDKEIKILSTYLKLEQLRFEFDYNFRIDESININEIEFPGMLLQPLVENAVRHGVSGLRGEGEIIIHFYRDNQSLIAEITDNGKGFENKTQINGYGCKLTDDNIKLLNKISGSELITKNIFRKNKKTVIQISFKNKL